LPHFVSARPNLFRSQEITVGIQPVSQKLDADTRHECLAGGEGDLDGEYVSDGSYAQLASVERRDKNEIEPFLRTRPRDAVKKLMALTHLCFLRRFFQFEVSRELEEWFDEHGTPEELASIVSLLVVLANEYQPLDSADLAFPLASHLSTPEMRKLVEYGPIAIARHEMKYSSCGFELCVAVMMLPSGLWYHPALDGLNNKGIRESTAVKSPLSGAWR
jgi:hypothetical protein